MNKNLSREKNSVKNKDKNKKSNVEFLVKLLKALHFIKKFMYGSYEKIKKNIY
ncbi:hypothetical protein CDIV41_270265 [Carnobacterium divergens]|nr:hypothetical protein CDIV41_270265 [Carnobacterium divergens]